MVLYLYGMVFFKCHTKFNIHSNRFSTCRQTSSQGKTGNITSHYLSSMSFKVLISGPAKSLLRGNLQPVSWFSLSNLSRSGATVLCDTLTVHWLTDGWLRRWSWLIQMGAVMALTASKENNSAWWLQFERLQLNMLTSETGKTYHHTLDDFNWTLCYLS